MEWWNYFTGSHLHDHETDYDMWISIWIRRKPLFDPKNNPLPRVQIYSGHPSSNISKHHDQQKVGKLGFIQKKHQHQHQHQHQHHVQQKVGKLEFIQKEYQLQHQHQHVHIVITIRMVWHELPNHEKEKNKKQMVMRKHCNMIKCLLRLNVNKSVWHKNLSNFCFEIFCWKIEVKGLLCVARLKGGNNEEDCLLKYNTFFEYRDKISPRVTMILVQLKYPYSSGMWSRIVNFGTLIDSAWIVTKPNWPFKVREIEPFWSGLVWKLGRFDSCKHRVLWSSVWGSTNDQNFIHRRTYGRVFWPKHGNLGIKKMRQKWGWLGEGCEKGRLGAELCLGRVYQHW